MDLTRLLIPIIFGLALPFLNRRVASRVSFGRYLLRMLLLPGAFVLGLWLLDRATGGETLRLWWPSIVAFVVAGIVGYGLARVTDRPASGGVKVKRENRQ
jgi:hypothetical protein